MPSHVYVEPERWGPWRLDPDNLALVLVDREAHWLYTIDLERCTTAAAVLDWIMQVNGKGWADRVVGPLVAALDDVLYPQSTLCSWGRSKRLPKDELRKMVNEAARFGAPLFDVETLEPRGAA